MVNGRFVDVRALVDLDPNATMDLDELVLNLGRGGVDDDCRDESDNFLADDVADGGGLGVLATLG